MFPGGADAEEREEDEVCGDGQQAAEDDGGGDGGEEASGEDEEAIAIAFRLAAPEGLVGVAKAVGDLGEGVTGAGAALPILAPSGDGEVVAGHGAVDVEDVEAEGGDAAAEFGFFSGDQGGVETVGACEDAAAKEGVASTVLGQAWGVDPVEVEEMCIRDRGPPSMRNPDSRAEAILPPRWGEHSRRVKAGGVGEDCWR